MNSKVLILIYGPTCVGKTSTALTLADKWNAEIFSCDSRQLYREMTIGTAVPNTDELKAVKHHFIQSISIHTPVSVGKYLDLFDLKLKDYYQSHDIAVGVGGTGMYLKAILEGLNEFPTVPPEILQEINHDLQTHGLPYLVHELEAHDPVYHSKVDTSNVRRVTRAISVIRASGKPFSYFLAAEVNRELYFNPITIALVRDREELYNRINRRVDLMIEDGLVDEATSLYPLRQLRALDTVGYRELFDHIDGKTSLEEAIEFIKRNTRRYAKRQLTWLRNQMDYRTFHPDEQGKILSYIRSQLRK